MIQTTFPAIAFPWELDLIEITLASGSTSVAVSLALGTREFFSATLYDDGDGVVRLRDMAGLLSDISASVSVPATLTLTAGTDTATTTLLSCGRRLDVPASQFVPRRFLCATPRKKTYPQAVELLSAYDPESEETGCDLTLSWFNPDTGTVSTTSGTALEREESDGGIRNYGFRPSDYPSPSEGLILVQIVARSGLRTLTYDVVRHTLEDATPRSLGFTNAFGVEDTLHFFGTAERELKAERDSASLTGRGMTNYRTLLTPQWKIHTGVLDDDGVVLVEDLCQARDVWRMSDGVWLCVAEQELKHEDGGRYSVSQGSVTVREASDTPMLTTAAGRHVFDGTFDESFE